MLTQIQQTLFPPKNEARSRQTSLILQVEDLEVTYLEVVKVLHKVSFSLSRGTITALIGNNGAGKSTVLKAIAGTLEIEHGKVTGGRILQSGVPSQAAKDSDTIALVPEGRRIFKSLTVNDNLRVVTFDRKLARTEIKRRLERVYETFPELKELRQKKGGLLSGGEQQMLATGRALMLAPDLILFDEPSLGLSPILTEKLFDIFKKINKEFHTTLLIVEQNAEEALKIADKGLVMDSGQIVLSDVADDLLSSPEVKTLYLGGDSFASVATPTRNKRLRKKWFSLS